MKKFTDYAQEKLLDLYRNHDHEVGRVLKERDPAKYKDYESTDCITYSLNVISYAFKQIGNEKAAAQVWKLGQRGTDLARYLVNSQRWVGVYINPDSKHPVDADPEHVYTATMSSRTCKYYGIPLDYKVSNYTVTPKTHASFRQVSKRAPVTPLDSVSITSFNNVKFGFGVSRGGMHTWLFSLGKVYEVHWDAIGEGLYEETPLTEFGWLSGAVVVPLDQASQIAAAAKLPCAG